MRFNAFSSPMNLVFSLYSFTFVLHIILTKHYTIYICKICCSTLFAVNESYNRGSRVRTDDLLIQENLRLLYYFSFQFGNLIF